STGGNLGYAGGLNAAMRHIGEAGAVLVLNPDMSVERGAIAAMRARMLSTGAAAIVPLLRDEDGTIYPSLRREPTITRAISDALMGSRLPSRPSWLSEMDFDMDSYRHPHPVDWATGASLLVRQDVALALGNWDERYFLYSEETDYFRRIRERGDAVWFEPAATMHHRRGGSGSSPELIALMAVNRVRYARAHRSPAYAMVFHAAVTVAELARSYQRDHRASSAYLIGIRSWDGLPHATQPNEPAEPAGDDFPEGTVIIPAHNEAAVIGRTLASLAPLANAGRIEVIVACNGCSDGTEEIARSFGSVKVVSIAEASKAAALNAGDAAASGWPRLYLDADIEIQPAALRIVFDRLSSGGPLAVRPAFRYDTAGASPLVRAYYRARNRLPSVHTHLWGAGAYALGKDGHERLGSFPNMTGDDFFVDGLFHESEMEVLETPPVRVHTPRRGKDLVAVLRRVYRGNAEQSNSGGSAGRTIAQLLHSVRGPLSAMDGAVYAGFSLAGRRSAAQPPSILWERDDSSRGGD
ncbi:MAG: glycosyltransferase, partial [Actinomycetota bacterium]|nr:glycosyltransferase [Actinomycetota bacterium]